MAAVRLNCLISEIQYGFKVVDGAVELGVLSRGKS